MTNEDKATKLYLKGQTKWCKNANIEVGTKVTILQAAESNQAGWPSPFPEFMLNYVGKTGTVVWPDDVGGVMVEMEDGITVHFPFFILCKAE
jgi:hypothetical protein